MHLRLPVDRVTVEMAMSRTTAKVEWQNAEITEALSSIKLTPTEALNENDFFPGDFITDTRKGETGACFCIRVYCSRDLISRSQTF